MYVFSFKIHQMWHKFVAAIMHAMLYTDFLHLVFPSRIVSKVCGDFFLQ